MLVSGSLLSSTSPSSFDQVLPGRLQPAVMRGLARDPRPPVRSHRCPGGRTQARLYGQDDDSFQAVELGLQLGRLHALIQADRRMGPPSRRLLCRRPAHKDCPDVRHPRGRPRRRRIRQESRRHDCRSGREQAVDRLGGRRTLRRGQSLSPFDPPVSRPSV